MLTFAISGYGKQASVEELKTKFQNASHPDEKASLATQIAEREVETADKLYRDGNIDEAQKNVTDAVHYADQARDSALVTGHHVKNIEITVRKMIHRLGDMKRLLSIDDQAPVQSAIDEMEKVRTDLLNRMFKAGK